MLDRIITYSFYALFFLTPLFWTSLNYELFEYNKMILVYGLTTIIVGSWILKMINERSLIFKQTPLDIPLLLFLGANILSTIFSIDTHASIWGYYSRSNGGLLSILSYLLLYWAFVANMDWNKIHRLLKIGLISGFIISLWAISEHFGVSPSCVILRGELNASCWVQDVQARVFATLGQPNWMASYLAMLMFPALYFFLTAKKNLELVIWYLVLIFYYLAFTFTYSRGPTLGLIGGLAVFLSFWLVPKSDLVQNRPALIWFNRFWSHPAKGRVPQNDTRFKSLLFVLSSFLIINILFGSALTSFRLVSKFAPPPRPAISLPTTSVTQLETGGTESGQIRFIVWQGALDIFKNYPIFGSGVETFAYSYYQYRPKEHNLTSEWDFLYNKAHNEYLNYLATTGLVGSTTYMIVILTFIIWSLKNSKQNNPNINLFIITLLASYVSYLIYNFFLFSVVIIAIFFYLFPAIAFVATESIKPFKLPSTFHALSTFQLIYHRPFYTKVAKGVIIFSVFSILFSVLRLWYADTLFAKGERASDLGKPGIAYSYLIKASQLNRGEPFFRGELAFSAAQAAVGLAEEDATLSASLKNEAEYEMEKVLRENPKNVSYFRTAVRTYFELTSIDKKYLDKTLQALDRSLSLAPTDPKLYYNKALVLLSIDKSAEATQFLHQALDLKPNYLEAQKQLDEITLGK